MNKRDRLQDDADAIRRSPYGFFINNPRVTILALLAVIIGGILGMTGMPLESDPEVKIPIGIVTTVYPGASPSDVEKLVTDILEERIQGLDNLDELTSVSSEGVSSIVVEFDASADIEESIRDLRDEVDIAKLDLPDGAEEPSVRDVQAGDDPIIAISLIGNITKEEFEEYAEELEDRLERIKGTDRADISGLPQKQMQVLIDIPTIEGLQLSMNDVITSIRNAHIDIPVGAIRTGTFYYQASLRGQFSGEEDLSELVIAERDGQNIYLRDIADVREVFGETSSETKIYIAETGEYQDTVTLQLYKQTGEDLVRIADEAKEVIETFKAEVLPDYVDVVISSDRSEFIREDISRLSMSALQTVILIGIVLFFAVGKREALIASSSIPLIFLLTFFGLWYFGETFNFMVLFSLILSLGIVVDTSIVIMEGIHDNETRHKMTPKDAALASIGTYKAPLIAGTLTTISAFVPMLLMSGIVGEYVSHIPITLNITLVSSLFVALTLVPAIASWIGKPNKEERPPLLSRYIVPLRHWYSEEIRKIVESKRQRRLWTIGMIVAFFVALAFPVVGLLKIQLFPADDADFFYATVEAPSGTVLDETIRLTEPVEAMIEGLPSVEYFISSYGGGAVGVFGGQVSAGSTDTNTANITVNLLKDRDMTSIEIAAMLREQVKSITNADVTVSELQSGPPSGAPVEVRLVGEDVALLQRYASTVERELEQVEGAIDVSAQVSLGTGEYHLLPRRDRIEYYGMTSSQIGQILRASVFGDDSVEIIRSGEETPIVVRLDYRDNDCTQDVITAIIESRDSVTVCRSNPRDIAQVLNLLIPTPRGQVPMSELVEVELHPAITAINHLDTDTVISVTAYIDEGFVVQDILAAMEERMQSQDVPEGIDIVYGGQNEDTDESFRSLGRAMIVAIILIAVILVYQFNSFIQPFIIMFTIPLAVVGVFPGLAILGRNFSFPGFIGFVALSGIVVNDAIVLIDMINKNIKLGMKPLDAVCNAGEERLQPILLTTATTALGMLPLVFASAVFGDLAIVVAVGITFSTVLTLVMVPVFFMGLIGRKMEKKMAQEIDNA